MKAILVIDLPNDTKAEDVCITYIVQDWYGMLVKAQVESVPLKSLPKKKPKYDRRGWTADYKQGWNDCLEQIED